MIKKNSYELVVGGYYVLAIKLCTKVLLPVLVYFIFQCLLMKATGICLIAEQIHSAPTKGYVFASKT